MNDLIYNRLSSDVDVALNNPSSTSSLKGAYNYTDLNRVEEWCKYLYEELKKYGFKNKLEINTNWNIRSYPTRTQIDRIRNNIKELKLYCYTLLSEEIIYNNTLNYEQANTLEKILYDINNYIEEMLISNEQKYNIGTNLIKNKYITTKVDTNTVGEIYTENAKNNIAVMLIQNRYIELKGEY